MGMEEKENEKIKWKNGRQNEKGRGLKAIKCDKQHGFQ